jgi:hypothetical protein
LLFCLCFCLFFFVFFCILYYSARWICFDHCITQICISTIYIYFPCIREIWRFLHPRKVISPEGNARGKYDYFEGEQIFISPLCKGNECFIPPGQRFGEFCQMKSFGHLCLQNYYFGTSLELSLLTWNTVIWPKR